MAQPHSEGAHTDDAHAHEHPPLPPVEDEAPDTPMWLPLTGLALLVVFVLFGAFRAAMHREEPPADAGVDAAAGDGAADAPAEGEAAAAE